MIVEWQNEPTHGIRQAANGCSFFLVTAFAMPIAQLTPTAAKDASYTADKPCRARTRSPAATPASFRSFSGNCDRPASRCQRWSTPVANVPSLRRMPACSRRTMISESSLPHPLSSASKPSTRSRSDCQIPRLHDRAPCQSRWRTRRKGPSGRRSSADNRLTPPRHRSRVSQDACARTDCDLISSTRDVLRISSSRARARATVAPLTTRWS